MLPRTERVTHDTDAKLARAVQHGSPRHEARVGMHYAGTGYNVLSDGLETGKDGTSAVSESLRFRARSIDSNCRYLLDFAANTLGQRSGPRDQRSSELR